MAINITREGGERMKTRKMQLILLVGAEVYPVSAISVCKVSQNNLARTVQDCTKVLPA